MTSNKRYGVYMISFKMWRGIIDYNQRPRFASDRLEDVILYADKALANSSNGTAYVIVDYPCKTAVLSKLKENDEIRIWQINIL